MASVMVQIYGAMRAQQNGATGGSKLKSFDDLKDDMTKAAQKYAGAPFANPSLGEQWLLENLASSLETSLWRKS